MPGPDADSASRSASIGTAADQRACGSCWTDRPLPATLCPRLTSREDARAMAELERKRRRGSAQRRPSPSTEGRSAARSVEWCGRHRAVEGSSSTRTICWRAWSQSSLRPRRFAALQRPPVSTRRRPGPRRAQREDRQSCSRCAAALLRLRTSSSRRPSGLAPLRPATALSVRASRAPRCPRALPRVLGTLGGVKEV